MFPSSSNSCSNPFSYNYENERSFANDENHNISGPEEHTGSSFLHFPSPFLDNDLELLENHLFSQHQLLAAADQAAAADQDEINTVENQPRPELVSNKRRTSGGIKQTELDRKRATGKKDRHSKIYTAQGPRDRRMRLSLQIARKFFGLQDMLGFDKASKTIEWLFTKSKTAIKELMGNLPQVKRNNFVSECEELGTPNTLKETSKHINNGDYKEAMGVKKDRKSRNPAFHPVSKDCRDKARARARERTREKMLRIVDKSKQWYGANPNYLEQAARSSNPFEHAEESSSPSQDMSSPLKTATHVGIMDKIFGMTSPSILNYSHNVVTESRDGTYSNDDFHGFQEDWSMENARI